MGTYIIRRILNTFVMVWAALSFLFLLIWIIPGDIVSQTGDTDRSLTPAVKRNLDRLYGLDDPVPIQYLKSLRRVATFDFGNSAGNRPIITMLKESFAASGRLAFWGVLTYCILGIVSGVYSAVRRNGGFDRFSGFLSVVLNALPPFVMGILLQILFGVVAYQQNWPNWLKFPVQWTDGPQRWVMGVIPLGGTWRTLLLPVLTVASVEFANQARGSRSVMLEVLRADYLRTARAKGLSERTTLFKHGLRNAFIPIITSIGIAIPGTFGYAILTETVWNIPGLGGTIAGAVASQDTATVLAFGSVIIVITALITLLVDLLYGVIDPRVKVQ
jgi:ABC-type dipeptide/oligopeptide/nickel transport system permease component